MKLFNWGNSSKPNPERRSRANPSGERIPRSNTSPAQSDSTSRFSKLLSSSSPRASLERSRTKQCNSPPSTRPPQSLARPDRNTCSSSVTQSSSSSRPSSSKDLPSTGKDAPKAPQDYEMKKRRVSINLAILERPLMTDTDVIVDIRYRSLKLVGSGSYGIVVSAIDDQTGNRVAIKKIFTAFSTGRMSRAVLREVRLLRHLRHRNIVHLLDIDVPRQYRAWDEVYLVTPLLKTDLRQALKDRIVRTSLQRKRIAYDLLCALEHMHSLGLMHRDIKSRNVLLDENFNAQICDLGHARFYSRATPELLGRGNEPLREKKRDPSSPDMEEPELSMNLTTIVQSAPELCLGGEYDAEVDIWAAGCVIAEMHHPHHEFLFDMTHRKAQLQEIVDIVGYPDDDINNVIPQAGQWYLRRLRKTKLNGKTRITERLGPKTDPVVVDLLEKMLRFSPKQRLSAKEALKHEWFDEVRGERGRGEETYDFRQSEPHRKATKAEMKNSVWEEVVAFHPEAPHLGVRKQR